MSSWFVLIWAEAWAYPVLGLGLSLEELGLRALERIPRDRAIDGIQAFMDLRSASIAPHKPPRS